MDLADEGGRMFLEKLLHSCNCLGEGSDKFCETSTNMRTLALVTAMRSRDFGNVLSDNG
jgi:hypothetical protein